jgi:hypothetical protein
VFGVSGVLSHVPPLAEGFGSKFESDFAKKPSQDSPEADKLAVSSDCLIIFRVFLLLKRAEVPAAEWIQARPHFPLHLFFK